MRMLRAIGAAAHAGAAGHAAAGPGRGHPWLAAGLSVVLPGAGHWYLRRWWRGMLFFVPSTAAVGYGAYLVGRGGGYLAGLVVQPRWLWALVAGNVLLALIRLTAAADAYRLARPWRGLTRVRIVGRGLGLAAAAAFIAAPHAAVAAYGLEAIDLLNDVFVADEAPVVVAVPAGAYRGPPPTIVPDTPPAPPPSFAPRDPRSAAQARAIIPASDLDPVRPVIVPDEPNYFDAPLLPIEERAGERRITVLLAGGDAGPGRGGLRTDVMIVATLDLETRHAALFGVPRNLAWVPLPSSFRYAFTGMQEDIRASLRRAWEAGQERVALESDPGVTTTSTVPPVYHDPIPAGRCGCFPDILNALHPSTRNWTRTFPGVPDPGMEALRQAVSHLLGLEIDYYVLVEMGGFVDLVDALGGVDIMVRERVVTEVSPAVEGEAWISIDLQPGPHHLDGRQALAYVRERKSTSDYVRMERQRCLVRAVAADADPLELARAFPRIADAIRSSTTTNIPLSFLPDLVQAAAGLDLNDITTTAFTPPTYSSGRDYRNRPIPNVSRIRATVEQVLAGEDLGGAAGASECS